MDIKTQSSLETKLYHELEYALNYRADAEILLGDIRGQLQIMAGNRKFMQVAGPARMLLNKLDKFEEQYDRK